MRIAITGSSGLIGTTLLTHFGRDGHSITRVLRRTTASDPRHYGNHGPDDRVDENAPRSPGLLADLVRDWEQAATPANAARIRVVHARFGIVLSPRGGALTARAQ